MASVAADPVVREIEDAFVAHWSHLGRWPGARLVDEDGVLRFETPLPVIPYNGVIGTRIRDAPDEAIARVVEAYRARGADFFWVVHPASTPADLAQRLEAAGLTPAEVATGMSLELGEWRARERESPPGVELREVVDEEGLRAYTDVSIAYWELDESAREHVLALNRHWSGPRAPGHRWIALLDGEPIGKAFLSLAGPPGVAAIYGMSVRAEARGRGIAGALTRTLLAQARAAGRHRVVLHSTEMAVGVYRRAGFVERCSMTFFATAPIWSDAH